MYIFIFIFLEANKITLFELNDILKAIQPYKPINGISSLSIADMDKLQELYNKTLELNDLVENIVHRAAMPRIKRARFTILYFILFYFILFYLTSF